MTAADRLYSRLVHRTPEREAALAPAVREQVPANGLRQVGAAALQSSGDQAVDASTVLPWLFAALGVPPALSGLLKPVRESLSMLPQAFLTPVVLRVRRRRRVFSAGALVQAAAVAAMAATAALATGLAAGVAILAALVVFSLGRCLCSIASKDVQGRTLPKGERGQVNGLATTAAGLVAITLGLGIRLLGGGEPSTAQLAWILAGAAVLWAGSAALYAAVREPGSEPDDTGSGRDADPHDDAPRPAGGGTSEPTRHDGALARSWRLLRDDAPFRRFVTVRALLLVTSLSPTFLVMLSLQAGTRALTGLGGFVVASGLASLLGGRISGRMADRSSRRLMSLAAGAASVVVLAVVALTALPAVHGTTAGVVLVVAYFLVALLHTGVRTGRKTYLVDMATGDTRTLYTAVSNTTMGVVLLVVGAVSSALAGFSPTAALLLLAVLGGVGAIAGARLPEVSRP